MTRFKSIDTKLFLTASLVATIVYVGSVMAADQTSTDAVMEMLLEKIEKRDELISDLRRRVEELERKSKAPPEISSRSPQESVTKDQSAAPTEPPPQPSQAEEVPPAKPGQFVVDEEAAERALDRTLVQSGVLLLSPGMLEVEPSLSYTRNESASPNFFTENDSTFVVDDVTRRDIIDADVNFRLGLPYDSQLEFRLPYRFVDESQVRELAGAPSAEQSESSSGLGDIRIGWAKTLLREQGWRPDLVGRIAWDTDSGDSSDNDVSLGGDFNELIASFSAVKRQDPLAFIGSLSYREALEKNDVKPGSDLTLSLGAALAASPETSLRFIFDQLFADEVEIDGRPISGSDDVIGSLTIGASSIIGRRTLLDVSANVGLNDSASDYSLRLSVGRRFGR